MIIIIANNWYYFTKVIATNGKWHLQLSTLMTFWMGGKKKKNHWMTLLPNTIAALGFSRGFGTKRKSFNS